MKRSLVLCAIAAITIVGPLIAGPVRPHLPGKDVWYLGSPRGYKPAVSAIRLEEQPVVPSPAAAVPAMMPHEKHAGQPVWLTLAAAAVIALAGTLALLIMVRGQLKKKTKLSVRTRAQVVGAETKTEAEEVPVVDPLLSALSFTESEEPADEDAEDVLRIAQQYQRGRGEVELAMRIRTQQQSPLTVPEKIKRAGDVRKASQKLALAKRLGVGKGEIALAARLHQVRISAAHVKEAL
ncbi:MAG: hypothetical protein NTV54_15290 [Ignavibacteriales bacterium]|nr:hypothetical protein [Ignavibacteriales bacterium]